MPVKMIKKKIAKVDNKKLNNILPVLRSRYNLPKNDPLHQELISYVRSINTKYVTPQEDSLNTFEFIDENSIKKAEIIETKYDLITNESGIKDFPANCPDVLKRWINFLKIQLSIDYQEIQAVNCQIHPPANKVSSYINSISRMEAKHAYRVVLFLCSDEYLSYKITDISEFQKLVGGTAAAPQNIGECVKRGNYYCYDQSGGMTLTLNFNDESSYVLSGERDSVKDKLPRSRYIISIEFIYTYETIRKNVSKTIKMVKNMSSDDSNSTQSKIQKKIYDSYLESYKEDLKEDFEDLKESSEETQGQIIVEEEDDIF